ncbi:MAG: ATP-binding protein [Desulfuromonadales bacterium]
MVDSYMALLNRIIRQAHVSEMPPFRKIWRILRLLQRTLELEDAALFFRRGRERHYRFQICARGCSDLVSPPLYDPPKNVLKISHTVSADTSELTVPLKKGRRIPAVLVLKSCPSSLEAERDFLSAISSLLVFLLDQAGRGALGTNRDDRQLEELTLLNRLSRALHGTLEIDQQMQLLLSGLALPEGGFERAMLFMVNERSGTLQGMLGVTRDMARKIFPDSEEQEIVPADSCLEEDKNDHDFSLLIRQQRLPLDPDHNALARAALQRRIFFVNQSREESSRISDMARELGLTSYVCLPLFARDRTRAVIVVDNPLTGRTPGRDQRRFLELFAKQAGQALETALLVQRLEDAHKELRETQEELIQGEKLAAIGEMAASVAHELKNPLVVVGGFARRLMRITEGESQAHQYSATIAREVDRLEEMLANILAFSRKSVACLAPCDPSRILHDALALGQGSAGRDEVVYEVSVEENLPRIQGDEQKLRQVLVNLLNNARQTLDGEGAITLQARRGMLRGDGAVVFEVADTGGGIPSSVIRNIFNPFFTTRDKGTGLGLSIAQRIVEQHHGHIEVQNSEQGARFRVSIPLHPPHGRAAY